MIRCHPIAGELTVILAGSLSVDPDTDQAVAALWAEAQAAQPQLFDGPILSVETFTETSLIVQRAHYRHVLAARRSPALADRLALRPLAVSGVLSCPDGFVAGRRAVTVTQGGGQWELAPSGGVEAPEDGSPPDPLGNLLREAWEELGLPPESLQAAKPLGLLEYLDSRVIDVVIPLHTALSAAEIQTRHRRDGTGEYSELRIAAAAALRREASAFIPESRAILHEWL